MNQIDSGYFERLREQLNQHPNNEFSERNIFELRDRLNRLVEEAQQERARDPTNHQGMQQQLRVFIEGCLNFIAYVLSSVEPQTQKGVKFQIRFATLELLQKKALLQHMTHSIVEQLTSVLEKDNENNAATAIRIMTDILKNNQQQSHQFQRSNSIFSDQLLVRLYFFFEQRIEFLVKFNQELKKTSYKKLLGDTHPNPFHDQNYVLQPEVEENKKEKDIRLNQYSLSFVTHIPPFLIFTIFVLDQMVKEETKTQMREILKRALKTMNQAINETNFPDLLQKVPRNIVQELFNAYSKFLQLFALVIKRDNENSMQPQSRLLKDISDQIKLDQVVATIIRILKHCPVDIMHLRIDISNRLKQALQQKRDAVQPNEIPDKINEIMANVAELIDEETIVGKSLKIAPYQKTNIYQNWLDIVKHVVQSYLPKSDTATQQPSNLEKMQTDFINNQMYMEKIFNTIFKVLFDSSLQLSIHEKALELIKVFLELFSKQSTYFIDKNLLQYYVDQPQQQSVPNDQMFKEITTHSPKYKLLDRLFQMIGMKLAQIRKQIQQAKEMLHRTKRWGIVKKTTAQTNVSSMPSNLDSLNDNYILKLEQYLKETEIDIDSNLITQQDQAATQVYTYDDEEEYQVNSISISTYSQYIEFARDVKSKIFDQLNDILTKLLQFVTTTNKEIVNKQKTKPNYQMPQKAPQFVLASNENKPYLSNLQCHYMSKIMKNGLMIFDELHDHQRNHFDILDYKKKTIPQFMQFFIQFQDPINFKNVFEPNSKLLLRISVGLIKTCPETHCLPLLLQDHLGIGTTADSAAPHKQSVKYYIEFLLHLYLRELQTTPELPSRFGFCRGGQVVKVSQQKDQDEYISLIQKLLRIPIRLFPRVKCQQNEEPIVKPLVKQLILFFVKKSHETYYPIDFLGLLLSLVKRIQNNDQTEGLSKYFQQLCDKYDRNDKQQIQSRQQCDLYHKLNLSGVNIVLNMFELFQTGIVEIQDIVAEVIANFPLQRIIQINLAKQYPVFAQCLFRALHNISTIENQVIQKTLIILENIVTNLSMEEMREFFGDLLQPFIEKLLTFPSEYKMADIYQKQQNLLMDPSFKSLKILSKLGSLARRSEWPIEIKRNHLDNPFKRNQFLEVQIEGLQNNVQLNLTETVRCAVEILQNVLEQQLATYLFKQSSIQHSYQIVKMILLGYYQMPITMENELHEKYQCDLYQYKIPEGMALEMKLQPHHLDHDQLIYQDEELISSVTKVFIGLSNFHNIIQTLTTATFQKIKEDVENIVTTLSEMFFIQLADEHCELIASMAPQEPDLHSLFSTTETIVANYLIDKPPAIKWISHLFRGLNKRYMLTAEENMNYKDFYIQQHEFIWNKLLMGNCLKKYKKIMHDHLEKNQNKKWAYDVYYTAIIRVFEEFVYEKFGKQTQLQKEDDRRRKIQIVQSYGGTMIPSEGLNCRSISIELLTEIQILRPKFEDYYQSTTITGLPYILDQRVLECSFILLRQLPETIRVVSQLLTKQLLFQTLNQLILNLNFDHSKQKHGQQSQTILQERLRQFVKIVTQNCFTYKKSLLEICFSLMDIIITYFQGNSAKLFYMNIGEGMTSNHEELIQQIPFDSALQCPQQFYWVNLGFSEILKSPYTESTVLQELVQGIKLLCEKNEQKMSDMMAQRFANGYRLLTYLLHKQGQSKGRSYFLFRVMDSEYQLDSGIDEQINKAFSCIAQNEEQYARQSKLILYSDESQPQQAAHINVSHGLDDLDFKINVEDIDFEIRWQSYMVVAMFAFLKQMATINYIFILQRHLQKTIDKNAQQKPPILAMKFKTVEILYEGLLRVEQSIRSAGYKYLQDLLQQEGISNDKTLFENDDRLKRVMKPLLTCVQSEIFHYVPSFLKSLKLILKIFSKVFHKALSDKLQGHLQKIVQDNPSPMTNNPLFCTTAEWSFQQQQSQESLNFQMGVVSGLLKLFQHLTYQLTNPVNGQQTSIVSKIMTDTNMLRRNYIFKVSQQQLNLSIDKPLVKFLNTLAANYFDVFANPFSPPQIATFQKQLEGVTQLLANQSPIKILQEQLMERLKYIKTIRQIISEPTAFPLREKLCREKSALPQKMEKFSQSIEGLSTALEKGLSSVQQPLATEQLQSFHQSYLQKLINVISEIKIEIVQFGFQLCKRNPAWLKRNTFFLDNCISSNVKELLERQKNNNLNKRLQNPSLQFAYNQLILSNSQINGLLNRHASMLKQYIAQNEDSQTAIKDMLKLILHAPQDKVKKWVVNVAMNKPTKLRKLIIEIWMENFKFADDDSMNQVQMMAGYHVMYPILFYSNQRGDLSKISELSLFKRMKDINDDLVVQYSKILGDIEHHAPLNFSYKLVSSNAAKLSDVNHYYKSSVIDMLQISSYLLCFQEQQLPQDLKMSFLQFGYDMLNKSDKLVAFYANLYFSKYLKKNGLIQNDPISVNKRYLKIYSRAIKQLDESGQSEQELYSLCKKIIGVVLPCLDEVDVHDQRDWISSTQQLLKQEQQSLDQEAAQKVSRFWQMFIRNHKIFHKHHETFTIHIINSMQQIGFFNNQGQSPQVQITNSYQNYRRIALDMAFLQVEWKAKQIKSNLQTSSKKFHDSFFQSEAQNHDESLSSEIYQSFFIKQSLKAHNVEDAELQKRALYLLKKILIIAPLTNYKMNMDTVKKNVANLLNQVQEPPQVTGSVRPLQQQPTTSPYFRYFMIVLHILLIIAEFQQSHKIPSLFQPYLDIVFHMNQLPDQVQQQNPPRPTQPTRMPPAPPPRTPAPIARPPYTPPIDRQAQHQNALAQDHAPLVFSIYNIFRKLLKVAKEQPSEQSEVFQNNLSTWIRDTIHSHPPFKRTQPSVGSFMGPRMPSQLVKVNILSVFLLKLFFNHDVTFVRPLVPALKRIAEMLAEYLKQKDKGEQYLDNMTKHNTPKKAFNLRDPGECQNDSTKQYIHTDLTTYIREFASLSDDFPFGIEKSDNMLYFPEDFPENQKIKFHLYRSALQKTLKMMAYNFDEIKDSKEQIEFLQLLMWVIETVPDYELKLECIAILRMLFINGLHNKEGFLQAIALHLSPVRASQVRSELAEMELNQQFKPSKLSYDSQLNFFFDLSKLQAMFDKKIDQRSSDSHDNQHGKIQDLKVFKVYFMFLCELLLVRPFKSQQGSITSGFYALKNILDKSPQGALREIRKLLQVISKLSTCLDYLQFFYKMILDIFGYTYERFLLFLFGDPTGRTDQPNQTEGEEIMLMAIKFLILGRGQLIKQEYKMPQQASIQVKLVPDCEQARMREEVLNKYLAIYYRKNYYNKLFNSSLKLITSEYLPSIVIYNLSYIPLQDQPQQPLRECIIPSAAIELMGTAANVSSRLLKPLFTQVIQQLNDLKTITQITDYIMLQNTSNGTLMTIAQFLVQQVLDEINNIHTLLDNPQMQLNFNNLIKCLIAKGLLPLAQNLLEQIYLNTDCDVTSQLNEDVLVLLQGVYQEQWNRPGLMGCKYITATQPWVKQLITSSLLREPVQQYQLVLNNQDSIDLFWEHLESETTQLQGIQKEYDQQVIHQLFTESLQQLNQWNTLKQIELSKVQAVQNKIMMGFREKQRDLNDAGWKDLNLLSDMKSPVLFQQNDLYCYNQAYFKLLDFVRDENSQNSHSRAANQVLPSIEQNLKYAQIINCYNFIKTLPKLTQSYDQMMTSSLLWGSKFLNFVSQFQLYTELEESLKQYANPNPPYPNQQQTGYESILDQIQNAYSSSLICKKYFFERQPQIIDQQQFTFDLISQRMIQLQMCLQRFNSQLGQFLNSSQQLPQTITLDQKSYQLALLDYKTLLYPIRYYQQNGILELFDEQSVIKEVPKPLQLYAEKLLQLERVKFKTQRISDVDNNQNILSELFGFFSNLTTSIFSADEYKNYMLSKIRRYKMINQCYKLLRLDSQESNAMQTESNEQKLEVMVSQTNEFFIQNQLSYLKFWRDAQKVYQLAHRKYMNNIKFAHHYIQIIPLSIQYKPNKFPLTGMYLFHILNVTNSTDSHVTDAFSQVINSIPLFLLQRFLIQLVSTFLKNPCDSIRKDCLEAIVKLCNYNPLNNLQLVQHIKSIGLCGDERVQQLVNSITYASKLNQKIATIYSLRYLFNSRLDQQVWDNVEEIVYICGKILDGKHFDLTSSNFNDKCLLLVNILQKNQSIKELFKLYVPINDLIKTLANQKQSSEQYKAVGQLYVFALKAIYHNLFGVTLNHTDDFNLQLSSAIHSLIPKQISISQLYAINDEFQINSFPMLALEGQLKRTQTFDTVSIVSMFPTIHIHFLRRKRFVRQIAVLGSDEKKYLFLLKQKKIESKKPVQNILDEYISTQFIKMTNLINQNYKETKVRNIKHIVTDRYLLESDRQLYQLEPYQEETQNLSNILDTILCNNHFNSKNPNQTKIPYYPIYSNKSDPNQIMDELVQKSDLTNYVQRFCKTIDTFVFMRKIIVTTIGVQYALGFTIADSHCPKQLENLQLNLSNGNFYQKKYLFKVSGQKLQLYDPYAIRYSRNIEHLVGEINQSAYLIPAFTATIMGILSSNDLNEYLNVLFWQLGCKESVEPFLKKLRDSVYENDLIDTKCERLLAISQALFGGQEKLKLWARRWF